MDSIDPMAILVSAGIVSVTVPLAFLYFVHWLDLYSSERPKLILLSLAWGTFSVWLAYQINHPMVPIYGKPFVIGVSGPFVEEIFKSLILIYLVSRADFTYTVDGAIYGFAVGMGFGAAENLFYLTKVEPDMTIVLAVSRVFSSALLHGVASGMVGTALARFRFGRGRNRIWSILLGWGAAVATHLTFNNVALQPWGQTGYVILVGIGLGGVALIAGFVMWGLRDERGWLRETLDEKLGVSEEEAGLIQHMGDLEELLAPVTKSFGKQKREQVAKFLHLEAQLGLKREIVGKTSDPKRRDELIDEVVVMEQQLDTQRRAVGLYVMSFVRSILPPSQWSLWARADQVIATQPILAGPSLWNIVAARLEKQNGTAGGGMFARIQSALNARTLAEPLTPAHVEALPDELRKAMQWVMKEEEVTVQHVARGMEHDEKVAHSMLNQLAERGFLRKVMVAGEARFRTRIPHDDTASARLTMWQAAHHKIKKSPA